MAMCPVFRAQPPAPTRRSDGVGPAVMGICRIFESSLMIRARDEILTMDLNEIAEFLNSAARSVGAEVTSPWFYLQLGLIVVGAGMALGVGTAIRARLDLTSFASGWAAPLPPLLRGVVGSAPTP